MLALGRFWKHVDKEIAAPCWQWTGCTCGGYGHFGCLGKIKLAHRISWEIYHQKEIPEGKPGEYIIMHTCDNRACVNPDHLRLGSQKDNILDAKSKGRISRKRSNWPAPKPGSVYYILKDLL
jgi:hypothetical protein